MAALNASDGAYPTDRGGEEPLAEAEYEEDPAVAEALLAGIPYRSPVLLRDGVVSTNGLAGSDGSRMLAFGEAGG